MRPNGERQPVRCPIAEAESLAEHVRRVVDAAPPLSPEHAARLRALLPLPAVPKTEATRAA